MQLKNRLVKADFWTDTGLAKELPAMGRMMYQGLWQLAEDKYKKLQKKLIDDDLSYQDFLRANDLSRVKEIHLLHLSDRNSNAERFKREIQEISGKPVYVAG
jgi:phosphoribosyl 1,2-cyclic phosphodiesterase